MKKVIVTIFLALFLSAGLASAIDQIDATRPTDNAKVSALPGKIREDRAKINELVAAATLPDAQDWRIVTISATAASGDKILVDTSSFTCEITLPSSPTAGQFFTVADMKGTFSTNPTTILHGTVKINGASSDYVCGTPRRFDVTYINADYGWSVVATSLFDQRSPGPIGETTPSTGKFSAITDTGLTASTPVFTDASKVLVSQTLVPIANGGTNAATAGAALTNLGAEAVANKDTDVTLAANSDTKYASQKATKAYVDTATTGMETTANKSTDGTMAANSDTLYPSQKAVKSYVNTMGASVSGTYTPTLTAQLNLTSVDARVCTYLRVGPIVIVYGSANVEVTAAGSTILRVSLPVASTFLLNTNCSGTGAYTDQGFAAFIYADTINHTANVLWSPSAGGAHSVYFSFMYVVQ